MKTMCLEYKLLVKRTICEVPLEFALTRLHCTCCSGVLSTDATHKGKESWFEETGLSTHASHLPQPKIANINMVMVHIYRFKRMSYPSSSFWYGSMCGGRMLEYGRNSTSFGHNRLLIPKLAHNASL